MTDPEFTHQVKTEIDNNNVLNKLCISYVGSKLTQVIQRNKSITSTTDKLEEIYTNL